MDSNESKTPSRQGLYALAASHSKEAIKTLVDIMLTSRNEGMRMGAAKAILDKCLPDLKASELTGQDGGPIQLYIDAGKGFIPSSTIAFAASTAGAAGGQSPIQGAGVAQTGTQDNNSDRGAGQTSTS